MDTDQTVIRCFEIETGLKQQYVAVIIYGKNIDNLKYIKVFVN